MRISKGADTRARVIAADSASHKSKLQPNQRAGLKVNGVKHSSSADADVFRTFNGNGDKSFELIKQTRNLLKVGERERAVEVPLQESLVNDSDFAFKMYCREIGQYRLITPTEEIELAKKVQRGDKTALKTMINANLRLVVKMARDYEGCGLPIMDLISEGNIGLMKGCEKFEPGRNAKLSTYASWWIKQQIKRALANQARTIRMPVHAVDAALNLNRTANRMQEELGRRPSYEEIADRSGMKLDRVKLMLDANRAPLNLDQPLGDGEGERTLADTVADENSEAPWARTVSVEDKAVVQELLSNLDERERRIIELRFGISDPAGRERTLEEVGKKFKVTRERIRQIQEIAMRKLGKFLKKRGESRD